MPNAVVYYSHIITPLTSRQELREKMRQAGRYTGSIKRPVQLLISKNKPPSIKKVMFSSPKAA